MKSYPANIARPRAIPLFHAVPVRDRHDGWTPRRQAAFIGHLAETRSVSEAARRVEMARESAYQLRRRPGAGSFCAAWDCALGRPRLPEPNGSLPNFTPPDPLRAAQMVWWKVHLDHGRFVGLSEKHYNSALLSLLGQFARSAGEVPRRAGARPPENRI